MQLMRSTSCTLKKVMKTSFASYRSQMHTSPNSYAGCKGCQHQRAAPVPSVTARASLPPNSAAVSSSGPTGS